MKITCLVAAAVVIGFAFSGCAKPTGDAAQLDEQDYSAPLPAGRVALRKVTDPARIPDFRPAFPMQIGLDAAAARSLNYLGKPSSLNYFPYDPGGEITHARAVDSVQLFRRTLAEARSPDELDGLIRQRFEVWESVGCDNQGTVLYTGYYCPIFDARLKPDAEFRYPLYRVPDDLVKDGGGNCLGRRLPDGSTTPLYPERRQIVGRNLPAGYELCYLRDAFEAYIVTVQGSARLRLGDGSYFEIGYAANNGRNYVAIGPLMIADGKIPPGKLSLARMMAFFNEFPGEIEYYTGKNPRYVFFQRCAGGPYGSLNETVTPYRTIATDKAVYPRACVAFVQTRLPGFVEGRIVDRAYGAFALDQDTGGAIRAAGRCDVFMGTGDAVAELAGRTVAEGKLYYIFAKPEFARAR